MSGIRHNDTVSFYQEENVWWLFLFQVQLADNDDPCLNTLTH